MKLEDVSHRAVAASLVAALVLPVLPASAQQWPHHIDPNAPVSGNIQEEDYPDLGRYPERSVRPHGRLRLEPRQTRYDLEYSRQGEIRRAMDIIHAAFPNDREKWREAFTLIGPARDPVKTAQTLVSHVSPQPVVAERLLPGMNPNDPMNRRFMAHEQAEKERKARLGRAFGIIQSAHFTDDSLVRRGGEIILQAKDPVRAAEAFVSEHRPPQPVVAEKTPSLPPASKSPEAQRAVVQTSERKVEQQASLPECTAEQQVLSKPEVGGDLGGAALCKPKPVVAVASASAPSSGDNSSEKAMHDALAWSQKPSTTSDLSVRPTTY